mgnify:CR=1 FL=1
MSPGFLTLKLLRGLLQGLLTLERDRNRNYRLHHQLPRIVRMRVSLRIRS